MADYDHIVGLFSNFVPKFKMLQQFVNVWTFYMDSSFRTVADSLLTLFLNIYNEGKLG